MNQTNDIIYINLHFFLVALIIQTVISFLFQKWPLYRKVILHSAMIAQLHQRVAELTRILKTQIPPTSKTLLTIHRASRKVRPLSLLMDQTHSPPPVLNSLNTALSSTAKNGTTPQSVPDTTKDQPPSSKALSRTSSSSSVQRIPKNTVIIKN